jgi:predicted nucleic acid-binding protein
MPGAKVFVDSTTFLYTIDQAERLKRRIAQEWLKALTRANLGATNLQVLSEVASVITRKTARFGDRDPFFDIDAFATFGSEPLTNESALAARSVFRRYGYSWWDCLLLASALYLGCTHFLSEDLQDGQTIAATVGGANRHLTVLDPFAHSPAEFQ